MRKIILCFVMLCHVNAFADVTKLDKEQIVNAELQKIQKLIKSYGLDMQIKVAPAAATVQPFAWNKNFKLKARCDDDTPVVIIDRDDGPSCAANCTWRSSSGDCLSYGADHCSSSGSVSCTPNCTWRSSSGECLSYGSDVCH